jgi:hypothetical protein
MPVCVFGEKMANVGWLVKLFSATLTYLHDRPYTAMFQELRSLVSLQGI